MLSRQVNSDICAYLDIRLLFLHALPLNCLDIPAVSDESLILENLFHKWSRFDMILVKRSLHTYVMKKSIFSRRNDGSNKYLCQISGNKSHKFEADYSYV